MMDFLLKCAILYVGVVYVLIPILCLVYTLFFAIGGSIVKAYYAVVDYLSEDHDKKNTKKKKKAK